MVEPIPFEVGSQYTRKDLYRILQIPDDRQGGDWDTGYHQHDGTWFVFASVGGAGRTGHEYGNRWDGDQLVWFGRTDSKLAHPRTQALLSANACVLIFTREEDRGPFTFQGRAVAAGSEDTVPVCIRWKFPDAPPPGARTAAASPPKLVDAETEQAFQEFRNDRSAQFMVRLRQWRAEQLRQLLASPDILSLATFNSEVWTVWSSAVLDGEDVAPLLSPHRKLTEDEVQRLEAGIQSGSLQVHGNAMWGSGTRIYGAMLQGGDDDRLAHVQQAVRTLNDGNLSPRSKIDELLELPGFGENVATGLVMAFHPHEIAIWNTPSKSAISKLGFHAENLDDFERLVGDLRKALGAQDFIELDYFFFLLDQGLLSFQAKSPAWWVCQGKMYDEERDGAYIFATKETADGKVVQHHANLAAMKPGQTVLHYANGELRAIGRVESGASERTRPDVMPGEESGRAGYHVPVHYRELNQPIALDEIPLEWRTSGEQPFTKTGKVKQGYLFPVSQSFLTKLMNRFADRFGSDPKTDRGPRVVKIAPGEGARYWEECLKGQFICVGWGDVGDLKRFQTKDEFREEFAKCFGEGYNGHEPTISRKANELWTLRELQAGDIVVANHGMSRVLAVGEVQQPVYEFRPDAARGEYSHLVHVRWDTSVAKDIPKQGFWAMATVADVPPDLYAFIIGDDSLPTPGLTIKPADYTEPSLEEIRKQLAKAGLRISERTLRRYHLSLKTRGFVILSGLSGSGKTWLAELYAKAIGAERDLVPVAPNWTTNEDLIGYLNPMDGKYHDTRFSHFLKRAAEHYEEAKAAGVIVRPFHLILDEMNLARVEYYFAKFLSAMEQRSRLGAEARIDLGGLDSVPLPPNLFFIGTVNIDETTHLFADKVYDRAQLLEINVDREDLAAHLGSAAYASTVLEVWDAVGEGARFGFRVLDEIKSYVDQAIGVGASWQDALDEQLLQKVLIKIKGADHRVQDALEQFIAKTGDAFPLSHAKAKRMLDAYQTHGICTYF